jgi:hypothetical protein
MFKSWKTSLAGLLLGASQIIVLPIHSWKDLIIPLSTLLLGLLAKDNDVTGKP